MFIINTHLPQFSRGTSNGRIVWPAKKQTTQHTPLLVGTNAFVHFILKNHWLSCHSPQPSHLRLALSLFTEMWRHSLQPGLVACNAVVSVCSRASLFGSKWLKCWGLRSKSMAQIPNGRLAKGQYEPICRGCAMYFSIIYCWQCWKLVGPKASTPKNNHSRGKSLLRRCVSYWNSPFVGGQG